jgi:hypothetical protein
VSAINTYQALNPVSIEDNLIEVHKSWSFNEITSASYGIVVGVMKLPPAGLYRGNLIPISESNVTLSYNSDNTITDIMGYKYKSVIKSRALEADIQPAATSSYINIPLLILGSGFKPNSLRISATDNGQTVNLKSKDGLLIDVDIESSSIIHSGGISYKLQPNMFTGSIGSEFTSSFAKVKLGAGPILSNGDVLGKSLIFNLTSSYYSIEHSQSFNTPSNGNYAIALGLNIPASQSGESLTSVLATKRSGSQINYPFDIRLGNTVDTNKVLANIGNETSPLYLTSSTLSPGSHFIVLNRSGSIISLNVDGNQVDSLTVQTRSLSVSNNTTPVYLGADTSRGSLFSGSIFLFNYYNVGLNSEHITALSDTSSLALFTQNNIAGIVTAEGVVYIGNTNPRYNKVMTGDGNFNYVSGSTFTCAFENIHTVREYSVSANLKAYTHNVSVNPSFLGNSNLSSASFTPYVTTVGLYDSNYTLLAVGKLSQPLKKDPEVTLTIKLNLDL